MAVYMVKPGTGNHSHVDMRGQRHLIQPGETFEAEPYQVENFLDKLEMVSPPDPPPPPPPVELQLQVREREDGEGFDVYNPVADKVLNTTPLTQTEAEELANVGATRKDMENPEDVEGGKGVHPRRGTKPKEPKPNPHKK